MKFRPLLFILFLLLLVILWAAPLLHPILHYDELSAVKRALDYPTLEEQWKLGITPDGHPPLLQLLIWSITQWIGIQPFVLRFIGVMFGVWAIWEGYKCAVQIISPAIKPRNNTDQFHWFLSKKNNEITEVTKGATNNANGNNYPLHGMITFLLLGFWWWSLAMGYQIRPYSVALPFVFKTWAWAFSSHWNSQRSIIQSILHLVLFTLVSAWIHHFAFLSSLTAIAIWILRFLYHRYKLSDRNSPPSEYFLLLLIPLFLGLGYLPIFQLVRSQWNEGGLSWLGKPSPQFLFDFFSNQLHPLLAVLLVGLMVSGFIANHRKAILLSGSFIFQYLVLHGYSILKMPVLQPSALYFSLPLLFVIADLGWKKYQPWLQTLGLAIMAILVLDTVFLQQWLTKRQQNYHFEFAKKIKESTHPVWIDAEKETVDFHLSQYPLPHTTVQWLSNTQKPEDIFKKFKEISKGDTLTVCLQAGTHPWALPLMQSYFTSSQIIDNYIGGQILQLNNFNPTRHFINPFQCTAENKIGSINKVQQCQYTCPIPLQNDTLINNSNDSQLFQFNARLGEFRPDPNDVLVVIVPVDWKSHYEGLVVESTLHNQENQIDWRGTLYQDFQFPTCNYAFHTLKLSDIPQWDANTRLGLKVYAAWAWVGILSGNPYQYGIAPYRINDKLRD